MITTDPLFDRIGVGQMLAAQVTLSQEQIDALKSELANAKYQGLTLAELLTELNQQVVGDNPEPQGRMPIASVPGSVFKQWCRYRLAETLGTKAQAIGQKWAGLSAALMPTIGDQEEILAESTTLASFAVGMLADGVCTQEQIDTLFSAPDVTYVARLRLPSVAETVTGVEGAMLTPSDLEGLI